MAKPRISVLSEEDIQRIHEASLKVLRDVGVRVTNPQARLGLADAGVNISQGSDIVKFPESIVMQAIEQAGKQYILHGRDPKRVARYGYGDQNQISSPGEYAWFDHQTGERRDPLLKDTIDAAILGDALPNITIVGGMSVPRDVPDEVRDIVMTATLVKNTTKPTWCWASGRRNAAYMLEIYKAIAGGKEALRRQPMVEVFLEPISPLQLADPSLDNIFEYIDHGQPVCVGPMASVSGTGPATLAGTLVQENAEILAGVVMVQAIGPGTPMMYGGIPHLLDPRSASFVFSSPEQALMAVAMVQMGKSYGFPVYVNVNLSDSKTLDAQAGMEKLGTLVPAMLAGADLFGHAGILGQDHGASLSFLVVDNEAVSFAKRMLRGFDITEETLATSVISEIGPGGNFLSHPHTRKNYRNEQWFPSELWTRKSFDAWKEEGSLTMGERAHTRVDQILENHKPEPVDPALLREIDRIVAAAQKDILGI